jgi:hypothetical protein
MKKIFTTLAFSLIFLSCSKNETPLDEKTISFAEMVNLFTQSANDITNIIPIQGIHPLSTDKSVLINEDQAIKIIAPLVESSALYLKTQYDINVYDYFYPGDPEIAQIGAFALRLEDAAAKGLVIDQNQLDAWLNELHLSTNGNAIVPQSRVVDCALDALGIPAAMIMGAVSSSMTKAAVLKAVRKLATRVLGWVGVAIAVVDFASCMDWI